MARCESAASAHTLGPTASQPGKVDFALALWLCAGTATAANGSTIVSGGGGGGSSLVSSALAKGGGLLSHLAGAGARRSSAIKAQLQRVSCGLGSDSGGSATFDGSIHAANMVYRMTGTTGSLVYMAPEVPQHRQWV